MRHIHSGAALILALSVPAVGQTGSDRWIIEVSNTIISPSQPSTRLRFLAAFDPRDKAFGSARWDVHATESGWSDPMMLLNPPFNLGTISGPSILGVVCGQVHFPPKVFANPTNPLPVYEVTWSTSDFRPRDVDIRTQTDHYFLYTFHGSRSAIPGLVEGRVTLTIIPAPSAWVILVAAFAGMRRRRATPGCSAIRQVVPSRTT